jgi:hypothetical protein
MTPSDPTDDTWKNSPFSAKRHTDDAVDKNFDELSTEEKVEHLAFAVERQAKLLEQMATAQGASQQADTGTSASKSDGVWLDSPFEFRG